MSKVTFTSLDIHNFSIITSVYVPLNNPGITIVDGPIGTGKSSILEAFYFCVTGEFFEKSSTFKSVINRFTKKPLELTVEGVTDVPFKIYRTMSFKSARSSEVKHTLEFYVNGEPLHDKVSGTVQVQDNILEYLDIDPLLLFNSKIFGQGDISSFTKVNDRKKKIILDKLVGVGICDKAYKTAVTMVTETTNSVVSLNTEILALKTRITELNTEIYELGIKQKEWKTAQTIDNSGVETRIATLASEISAGNIKITELTATKNELESTVEDAEKVKEQINKLKAYLPPVNKRIETFNDTRIRIDREKNFTIGTLSTLKSDIDRLNSFLSAGGSTKCPTCFSLIETETIEGALAELTASKANIDLHITLQEQDIKTAEEGYAKWVEQKSGIDNTISKLNVQLSNILSIHTKIDEIKSRILRLQSDNTEKLKLIDILQTPVEQKAVTSCPYAELIENKQNEVVTKSQEVTVKQKQLKIFETRKQYLTFLSKAFNNSGIPQLISKDVLKVLNILMGNYKNRLLGDDFYLQFKTRTVRENEEIYPDVVNPCGGEGYHRQSKGEKRKIDLCQMFALSDFAKMQGKCDINLMFFDEVFSELNHSESESVLEVIKEYPVTSKLIISHKDLFKEEYSNVIRMKKEGKISVADVNIVGWDGIRETTNDKGSTDKTQTS